MKRTKNEENEATVSIKQMNENVKKQQNDYEKDSSLPNKSAWTPPPPPKPSKE
jgi:hypothetical protein